MEDLIDMVSGGRMAPTQTVDGRKTYKLPQCSVLQNRRSLALIGTVNKGDNTLAKHVSTACD